MRPPTSHQKRHVDSRLDDRYGVDSAVRSPVFSYLHGRWFYRQIPTVVIDSLGAFELLPTRLELFIGEITSGVRHS